MMINQLQDHKSRLKVLMLETGGWGGIWHYACCLGNALWEHGVDLNMITPSGFEVPFELKFRVLPVIRRDESYLENIIHIYRTWQRLKPSLFHVQSWFSARRDWLQFRLISKLKTPMVLTAHNLLPHDDIERQAAFMSWTFKQIYRSADKVIVHSAANKQSLKETLGIANRKISVIKHGNFRFFADKFDIDPLVARNTLTGERENRKIFLIFGTIRKYKGIDVALQAMSNLPSIEKMHLVVAGNPYGRVMEDYKAQAENLKIVDHVTFLPGYFTHKEIARLHAAADVCIFPYREIFESGALQTALGFGKPVIATSVGSFPETLKNKNAWMVEPNSSVSLAQAMERAIAAPTAELAAMGRESLRISTEEHDWRRIAQKTEEIYLSLT
jgi:glycosyltransferase involved in cell wall biosynthesis